MPLYVVRWLDERVSIIRAQSEEHLLELIDEFASPSECTWVQYSGPLWFDIELPFEWKLRTPVLPGEKCSPKAVTVTVASKEASLEGLRPVPSDTETHWEMIRTVLRKTYPAFAEELLDGDFEEKSARDALSRDIARLVNLTRERGITLTRSGALRVTKAFPYLRIKHGRFIPIKEGAIARFAIGRGMLPPEADGTVRVVWVHVRYYRNRPEVASVGNGLKLGADDSGLVRTPHRADVYGGLKDEQESSPFERRRNATVSWTVDEFDRAALGQLVLRRFGVEVEGDPNGD